MRQNHEEKSGEINRLVSRFLVETKTVLRAILKKTIIIMSARMMTPSWPSTIATETSLVEGLPGPKGLYSSLLHYSAVEESTVSG